jgi:DNA repair protein RadC
VAGRAPGNPALNSPRPANMSQLYVRDESGYRIAEPADIINRAKSIISQRYRVGSPVLSAPELTRSYLAVHLGACDYEQFGMLHLDGRHRLIKVETLFRGSISAAAVYPREVVKAALASSAAAVVLFHNHPSGVSEPSQADELITRRIKEALALVEIRVLDHLIVAETIFSFCEHGLI